MSRTLWSLSRTLWSFSKSCKNLKAICSSLRINPQTPAAYHLIRRHACSDNLLPFTYQLLEDNMNREGKSANALFLFIFTKTPNNMDMCNITKLCSMKIEVESLRKKVYPPLPRLLSQHDHTSNYLKCPMNPLSRPPREKRTVKSKIAFEKRREKAELPTLQSTPENLLTRISQKISRSTLSSFHY
ncbi:hypothetical protein NPIL_5471 [Nephila pilipes]|uniref:Uncharacterized protein n=1 Tax=Nephila pilipes TaxID=299642 RepID=A0A8X6MNY2_NEPPI|nr:hypothetical protein NPIL_5471 [Nephila pilipes]